MPGRPKSWRPFLGGRGKASLLETRDGGDATAQNIAKTNDPVNVTATAAAFGGAGGLGSDGGADGGRAEAFFPRGAALVQAIVTTSIAGNGIFVVRHRADAEYAKAAPFPSLWVWKNRRRRAELYSSMTSTPR